MAQNYKQALGRPRLLISPRNLIGLSGNFIYFLSSFPRETILISYI